jgi:hypothetical protein
MDTKLKGSPSPCGHSQGQNFSTHPKQQRADIYIFTDNNICLGSLAVRPGASALRPCSFSINEFENDRFGSRREAAGLDLYLIQSLSLECIENDLEAADSEIKISNKKLMLPTRPPSATNSPLGYGDGIQF